jgi:O-antigen/teichoic acid export membrane protein
VSRHDNTRKAIQLCVLAGVNYFIFYGLGIFLARTLGMKGFGQYNVAVASLTMLASLATLGLEKFALRTFPTYIEQGRWDYARGFARFSMRTILVVSVAAAIAFAAGNWWSYVAFRTSPLMAIIMLIAIVSSMSLVMFLIEMLSASGNAVLVTIIYRLLLPASVFVLVGVAYLLPAALTPRRAVLCYVSAWVISLLALLRLSRRKLPADIWTAEDSYMSRKWIRGALPFFVQSLMMTQFASSGVIVLKLLRTSDFEISLYAASMQVASFAVLLATSTTRLYAPKLAILLDRQDWDSLMRLKRERNAWIDPIILVFLLTILLFGKRIVGLYGPGFERGYPALCILAIGISVSVKYAMAPYALQFIGKPRWVLGAICVAGILNLALLVTLGRLFGATGAAIAYSSSLSAMSISMYMMGFYWVRSKNNDRPIA